LNKDTFVVARRYSPNSKAKMYTPKENTNSFSELASRRSSLNFPKTSSVQRTRIQSAKPKKEVQFVPVQSSVHFKDDNERVS